MIAENRPRRLKGLLVSLKPPTEQEKGFVHSAPSQNPLLFTTPTVGGPTAGNIHPPLARLFLPASVAKC